VTEEFKELWVAPHMFNYDIELAYLLLERVKTCSRLSYFSKNVVVYAERVITFVGYTCSVLVL
jgi:hypothetical protein